MRTSLIGLVVCIWLLCSAFIVNLEWRPNSDDHDEFVIEYKPENGGWEEMARKGREERTMAVTEERPGQHCYRVRARNEGGKSKPSESKCVLN